MICNTIKYRGYVGTIEISEEDDVIFGKVVGISDLISYEGKTCSDVVGDFHEAVDDYLLTCEREGIAPEVPYKGSFNVRVSPGLHERLARYAISAGKSLNSCVQEALERYVSSVVETQA
ncbi:MAG: type II toxin-antitoxin system HicB family antitoxin [Atopobiaceae bacterium]|jgi:predicted HicB family RNase H-like nuclease|nr:type II toxin-antitoxin system HicB family antitoxin [Atopobiaceae bacterium]